MTDIKQQALADQLLAGNFTKAGSTVTELSDPLVDTPMVVTLEQLRAYEHNPRIMQNPLFEEIKASIRERGLDAPPAITRRPGEKHFIIRNGGNTRLRILNELWKETGDERFFRIHCLFRPWIDEITALTGHLAENELHGQLTFIEKALAVSKVAEFYEKEFAVKLTQKQLALKLTEVGYPASQTQISQMQEAVNYLLPIMPNILYGGLSRRMVEHILRLRRAAKSTWDKYAELSTNTTNYNFDDLFMEVLSLFDNQGNELDFNRCQDELIGRIAEIFKCSYDTISLEFVERNARQKWLESSPPTEIDIDEATLFAKKPPAGEVHDQKIIDAQEILTSLAPKVIKKEPSIVITRTNKNNEKETNVAVTRTSTVCSTENTEVDPQNTDLDNQSLLSDNEQTEQFVNEHIISPIETTSRLEAIQTMVSQCTGDEFPDFKTNVIKSIPVQAGGLYPISDIWHIARSLDTPEQLRLHIGQLVLEIASDLGIEGAIQTTQDGIGFNCAPIECEDKTAQVLFYFLSALSSNSFIGTMSPAELLIAIISLLSGHHTGTTHVEVLNDVAFVKLIRVLRLTRRLCESEA